MANRVFPYLKTAAPTVNDDTGDGYKVGDEWLDTTNDIMYKAIDVTAGAAIWVELVGRTQTQTLTNKTLTAPTIADFTNAAHDHGDADDGGAIVSTRCVLYGQTANETPADSTTYYFGLPLRAGLTTSATGRKIFIPFAGTITRIDTGIIIASGGTSGSAETSTLSLRLNNTSDTTISSAIVCNQTAGGAGTFFNTTGLSVAVVAGDYVELKWVTPAWATNPVSVNIMCQIYVD